eukprot:TRINITY_DN15223_c1_g2_i2.p1 TRINITY_DN15223_c1_g2~~TRINITY_DN15223_c1_g2_i2.p1  ORF type:complete len:462 (+),score=68.30 TRINITY_DN15223_c1_g2_i2:120-1388(+)
MAKAKRTYHEAMIQKLFPRSLQGRGFVATSNCRNEAMFQEATQFSYWLVSIEKDILSMEKTIDRFLNNTGTFMQSNLPSVYEESTPGLATTVALSPKMVGEGLNFQQFTEAPADAKTKMNSDVLQPLKNWLSGYSQIKKRMVEVENLRLEVDSRRRTVQSMGATLSRAQTRHYKTGPNPSVEEKLQHQESRVKHKTAKAESALCQYKELEADTFAQLCDLIKDTVFLKQYMAEAMLIQADCFNTAYAAFTGRAPLTENRGNMQMAALTPQVTSGSETSTPVRVQQEEEHTSKEVEGASDSFEPPPQPPISNPFDRKSIIAKVDSASNPFMGEKSTENNPFSVQQTISEEGEKSSEINPFSGKKSSNEESNPFQEQRHYPEVDQSSVKLHVDFDQTGDGDEDQPVKANFTYDSAHSNPFSALK